MTIVQDLAQLWRDELVPQTTNVAVEGESLNINVRCAKDRGAWALVTSARLHADEAVLDDVDATDTVLARKRVECEEDLDAVGPCLRAGDDLGG